MQTELLHLTIIRAITASRALSHSEVIVIILHFEVYGFLGRPDPVKLDFDPTLNIMTGPNGSGKTNILKLMWSIMSGNIIIALEEIEFSRAILITDQYECTVVRLGKRTCRVLYQSARHEFEFSDIEDNDGDVIENAEDLAKEYLVPIGSSVFFPTFRRIEGGFRISASTEAPGIGSVFARQSRAKAALDEALISLSRTLTNGHHVFVSALSTTDVISILLRKYAELSEEANRFQSSTSQEIIHRIRGFRPSGTEANQLFDAKEVLNDIRKQVEHIEYFRKSIMSPMDEIQGLISRIFKYAGIKFGARMNIGDAASAINSDSMSSGEKQMLSFLCYNAFNTEAVIFIDEPELSLHLDWQRSLFSILLRQNSGNQFIVATHSPFIYTKYPEKEIIIPEYRNHNSPEL